MEFNRTGSSSKIGVASSGGFVGGAVGDFVGDPVGDFVGVFDGESVGLGTGALVGESVSVRPMTASISSWSNGG